MDFHFHNRQYVTPPASLTKFLLHPYYGDRKSIELSTLKR